MRYNKEERKRERERERERERDAFVETAFVYCIDKLGCKI